MTAVNPAFHVPIAKGQPVLRLTTLDKNGAALPGGERKTRVVGAAPAGFVALILAFVPLAVMTVVLIARARRLGS
jgi:hypothetical protein